MDPMLATTPAHPPLAHTGGPTFEPTTRPAGTDPAGPTGRRRLLRDLARLARPEHWIKNLVFIPLALIGASGVALSDLARIGWAVLAFCLGSSVIYVINDIADRNRDWAHPVKRERPIAAGRIRPVTASVFAMAIAVALLAVLMLGPDLGWWPLVVYLGLNVAYSHGLKRVPLLDMFVVASGFGLRVLQGSVALEVVASRWLLIAVFAVCLLLILGKRRHEVGTGGAIHRPSLAGYSPQFLEYLMVLCGAVAVTAGLLYLNDPPHSDTVLLLSVPLAIFGFARYLQLVMVRSGGGDPVRMLRDPAILVTALLWASTVVAATVFPLPGLTALSAW